jgi:hypothetical protein
MRNKTITAMRDNMYLLFIEPLLNHSLPPEDGVPPESNAL